jgi:hypothetical protein
MRDLVGLFKSLNVAANLARTLAQFVRQRLLRRVAVAIAPGESHQALVQALRTIPQ